MKQNLKFEIEIFDVRTKTSTKILNDSKLVKSIQIQKNIHLDNYAKITFVKPEIYKLIKGVETKLKLYNYVKIKLTTTNYDGSNIVFSSDSEEIKTSDVFYFSGFITKIQKAHSLERKIENNIVLTIADFSSLFKTTFYTKNLMFLDIVQKMNIDLRLLQITEVFNDVKNNLVSKFYSPNQIGFIFFAFFFYKFLYPIVYEKDSSGFRGSKKIDSNGNPIFKDFQIFMPFDIDLGGKKSMFLSQSTSMITYKQFQSVAWDLFKYLFPEPFFEFNTFENENSVSLIIRPTPFMTFGESNRIKYSDFENKASTRDKNEFINISAATTRDFLRDYKVIEYYDFGFENVINNSTDVLNSIKNKNKKISESIKVDYKLPSDATSLSILLPDENECVEIIENYYKEKFFNTKYLLSINFNRDANSIVNLIWTTPVTDTAVLNSSGRSIVFSFFEQKLLKYKSDFAFEEYLKNQFSGNFDSNPTFLWNYKNYSDKYVSGDINYFGIREFEAKWNYLTLYDDAIYKILSDINVYALDKIIDACEEDKILQEKLKQYYDEETKNVSVDRKGVHNLDLKQQSPTFDAKNVVDFAAPPIRSAPVKSIDVKKSNNNFLLKKAFTDEFIEQVRENFNDEIANNLKQAKTGQDIADVLISMRKLSFNSLSELSSRLNHIISLAYKENEHLYECFISTILNTSILPGFIMSSYSDNEFYSLPKFKGYVTSIEHSIDFNIGLFRTFVTLSRTASDDSWVE